MPQKGARWTVKWTVRWMKHKWSYLVSYLPWLQNHIAQIMFFYRIRSEKNDYLLESFDCKECIEDVLEDCLPLLNEKKILLTVEIEEGCTLYMDRRSFSFIASQLLGNAIKYSGESPQNLVSDSKSPTESHEFFQDDIDDNVQIPKIHITARRTGEKTTVCFRDNGCGVKSCDLPHIFEKGFTGDSGEIRRKSTEVVSSQKMIAL